MTSSAGEATVPVKHTDRFFIGFKSDFDMGHGGFKQSGIGRELGREGMRDFTETHVMAVPAE